MKKYKFVKFEIKLLGYQILAESIISDSRKVIIIEVLERPITISKFKKFLEAVSFFKKYIKNLNKLLNYSMIWFWLNSVTVRH